MSTSSRTGMTRSVGICALAAAAVILAAGTGSFADDPKDVTVVGPVTVQGDVGVHGQVGTYALDDPALTPFMAETKITIPDGGGGTYGFDIGSVPMGSRLVIEFVSAECDTPVGNDVTNALIITSVALPNGDIVGGTFDVPLGYRGINYVNDEVFVGGLSTRLYADGLARTGGAVGGGVMRSTGSGSTTCYFSITGHLLPMPAASMTNAPISGNLEDATPQEMTVPYSAALPPGTLKVPPGTVVKVLAP